MLHLALLLLPLFGHALADAPCQIFVSNSHKNASIPRSPDFTGVIDMWFWAANGTNFTVTYPREKTVDTFTATYQTLRTGWIKTTLDWPVGKYWEHMGTLSIPSVKYLKNGAWVTQMTINVGHTETPRMVVASTAPMVWIKQKSCDITSLDYKLFLGESSCSSLPYDSPTDSPSTVTTVSPTVPTTAQSSTAAAIVTVPTAAIVVPATAAASVSNICSPNNSNSQSSSITFLAVLLVLVTLVLIVLSVYTYRLRNQLGITGANVSFQPLTNNGTTIPRTNGVHGSQNSLNDVSVPLH